LRIQLKLQIQRLRDSEIVNLRDTLHNNRFCLTFQMIDLTGMYDDIQDRIWEIEKVFKKPIKSGWQLLRLEF
jgi:hypothetical protein